MLEFLHFEKSKDKLALGLWISKFYFKGVGVVVFQIERNVNWLAEHAGALEDVGAILISRHWWVQSGGVVQEIAVWPLEL